MCSELEDELKKAFAAARLLAEHLETMGSEKAEIPIETDNGCYHITIVKTL